MLRELTDTQRRRHCGARLKELQRMTYVRRCKRSVDELAVDSRRRSACGASSSSSVTSAIKL